MTAHSARDEGAPAAYDAGTEDEFREFLADRYRRQMVPTTDKQVELALRRHLPVSVDGGPTLCICDVTQTYDGPVGHRLHVVAELRKAGMLRD